LCAASMTAADSYEPVAQKATIDGVMQAFGTDD
jgi:hypothetical protein